VSGGSSRRASKKKERLDFIGSIPTSSPVMTLPSLSKQTMGREWRGEEEGERERRSLSYID
jgi:hypothetical protein